MFVEFRWAHRFTKYIYNWVAYRLDIIHFIGPKYVIFTQHRPNYTLGMYMLAVSYLSLEISKFISTRTWKNYP